MEVQRKGRCLLFSYQQAREAVGSKASEHRAVSTPNMGPSGRSTGEACKAMRNTHTLACKAMRNTHAQKEREREREGEREGEKGREREGERERESTATSH